MNIKKYKTKFLLIMLPIILSAGIITGCSGSGDGGGGGNGDNGDPTVNPQIEEVLSNVRRYNKTKICPSTRATIYLK